MVPGQASKPSTACPEVNLLKLRHFNKRVGRANSSDPELLHLAFKDALHEARSALAPKRWLPDTAQASNSKP